MNKYLINNNSKNLIIFFCGWGCDEYEFNHLQANSDVLLLFNYTDLGLDFDFSKYNEFNLMAFSAGVFIASIFQFGFDINKKIAVSGNPYLFDEHLGLSEKFQDILYNITEENADDFARNYLVKTEDEWKKFHHSKRTPDSCKFEFDCLKNIYKTQKQNIKNIYDFAIMGNEDPIFNYSAQKEFFDNRLRTIENARHNLFFRINNYEQLLNLAISDNV